MMSLVTWMGWGVDLSRQPRIETMMQMLDFSFFFFFF
jgi:hypothetical protein